MDQYLPENNLGGRFPTIGSFYAVFLNLLFGTGIAISIVAIIYSGILFITSRGDPKATDKAKSALTYSIIAMLLAFSAFSIRILITSLIGADVPGFG